MGAVPFFVAQKEEKGMKNEYINANNSDYYPLILLNRKDIRLPIGAKYLYGLLFDKLSSGNSDSLGRRFVIYRTEDIQNDMHESEKEINDYLIMLEASDFIEKVNDNTESFYLKTCYN